MAREFANRIGTFKWLLPILAFSLLAGVYVVSLDGSDRRPTLQIVTGIENAGLFEGQPGATDQTIIEEFERRENINIEVEFQGSVDTMLALQQGDHAYDAVWPASSVWLNMGDLHITVSRTKSVMQTPVVFAVKRSVADELGWIGREVKVDDILGAVDSGQIRYMMTSATQSNSGAMAYLGYLYAFAGQPNVLTNHNLSDPSVVEPARRILGAIDRSAGNSGILTENFLTLYQFYDGMVNYESEVIAANRELEAAGQEQLYVIYPVDGLAMADWPLGFIDRGEEEKSAIFDELQQYLLSDAVQDRLLDEGMRTESYSPLPDGIAADVLDLGTGIDRAHEFRPITMPPPEVVHQALVLYQTELRKPSFTVLCLDFSEGLDENGQDALMAAMRVMLEPELAARYYLQPSTRDVTIVIPFSEEALAQWTVEGNDPAALRDVLAKINGLEPGGPSNIYAAVIAALDAMQEKIDGYAPSIILMTDGDSDSGSFGGLLSRYNQGSPNEVPVYAILVGHALEEPLLEITEMTYGQTFDGRVNLIDALREAKGYN
jgi:Ca-activated chloride channel family protein